MIKLKKEPQKVPSSNLFPVIGIGASAGGLDAFRRFLKAMPERSGMAYIIVQHLDPTHQSLLPDILSKITKIPIHEITNNIVVEPDNIYIIPHNKLLTATDGILKLTPRPAMKNFLSIDLFFVSLAEIHKADAIGVVLSGTGTDGTQGLKAIKDQGGATFAQDPESSGYSSMPENAIDSGVVDYILTPEEIVKKLMETFSPLNRKDADKDRRPVTDEEIEDKIYEQIVSLLDLRKNVDFTYYKQTTIRRRINHRMGLNKIDNVEDYFIYINENTPEQDALYEDMLIHATGFFRDPQAFANLCELTFPSILLSKPGSEPIRIWVAGCSTGEEAYSIAMCLREYIDDKLSQGETHTTGASGKATEKLLNAKIRIFASDISEMAVTKARRGLYSETELKGVSDVQIKKFFTKEGDNFTVNKTLREMCVFACHNLLKDPPFPHIDLISCRNVLIYMERFLQNKALSNFHYALGQKGFLLLGKSETANNTPDLFIPISKIEKLYLKKSTPSRYMPSGPAQKEKSLADGRPTTQKSDGGKEDYQKISDNILLTTFIPAGVVINEQSDIVHFRGPTGEYLEPSPGKASLNLLKMAREGLAYELRRILQKVKTSKIAVTKKNIAFKVNNGLRFVDIMAIPMPSTIDPFYLIVFQQSHAQANETEPAVSDTKSKTGFTKRDLQHLRIQQLEKELSEARLDMRSITETQEAANEELQSANEELLSGSEELQSLNQELITSKEEVQSSNDQLSFLNQELQESNDQLNITRKYSEAIVNTVREPLLIMDLDLKIKSANPSFYHFFNTTEAETEGRLFNEIGNGQWNIPYLLTQLENVAYKKMMLSEFEVNMVFQNLGQRDLLLNARLIDERKESEKLILLSVEDVTETRRSANLVRESEKRLQEIFNHTFVGLGFSDLSGRFIQVNKSFCQITGYTEEELMKLNLQSISHPDQFEKKNQELQNLINGTIAGFVIEQQYIRKDGTSIWVKNSVSLVNVEEGTAKVIVIICQDIDKEKHAQQLLEESNQRFIFLANTMPIQMWTASVDGQMTYFNQAVYDYSGLGFDDLKGINWQKVVHQEDREKNLSIWEEGIAKGKDIVLEHRFMSHDGTYRWHLSRAQAQRDTEGKILIWVGTSTDINDQKQMEEELERRVIQRTEALQEANANLENSNNDLEQFAYIASHDLQEPLRKVRTYSTWLNDHFDLPEDAREYVSKITSSGQRMAALIDDLLNFYLLLRPDVAMETIDLNMVLNSVINDFNLLIEQKKAVLHIDRLPTLQAIPLQMNQLFHNLLSNALKFTTEDTSPVITISSRMLSGDEIKLHTLNQQVTYCEIVFKDNGIGFDQEFAERIFVIFQRLNSRQKFSGTGIGLALCNKIVTNHSGRIFAQGDLNTGTSFHIILPLQIG